MQAQYESNIEQTYNAEDWLDSDEQSTSSKQHRKESKRDRQDDRRKSRELKRGEF